MERDVAKFAMGTLAVVALFDVATHGQGVAQDNAEAVKNVHHGFTGLREE